MAASCFSRHTSPRMWAADADTGFGEGGGGERGREYVRCGGANIAAATDNQTPPSQALVACGGLGICAHIRRV